MGFEEYVDGYIHECECRGISKNILETRRSFLSKWHTWLKSERPKISLENANAEIILRFVKRQGTFKSRSTVAGYMSILRCYGDYLNRQGVWKRNHLRWVRSPKVAVNSHIPKSLSKTEIEKLIAESFKQKTRLSQHLWPAVILCLYSLGIRRGELLRLKLSDWNNKEKQFKITNTKSGFERYMPVPESLARSIEAYLIVRHQILVSKNKETETALVINQLGDPMAECSFSVSLNKIAARVGIKSFSTHRLRHSCATHLLESGASTPEVKMILGHSCVITTMRYLNVSSPERKKAIELHPINKMLEVNIYGE